MITMQNIGFAGDCGRYASVLKGRFGGELWGIWASELQPDETIVDIVWHVILKVDNDLYLDANGSHTGHDILLTIDDSYLEEYHVTDMWIAQVTIKDIKDSGIPL